LLARHRDFRLLWCGEVAGKYGQSVTSVAMPLVAVATLHASPFRVGLLSAATWFAWLLIGLPVGAWVDRWRRRPIMLAAAAVSLLAFASVPVAHRFGALTYWMLLGVALVVGLAAVFFQTAYSAYLPSLVAPQDRSEGNAKLSGSGSAAQLAGFGTGGLIIQLAGAVDGLLANAGTFLISLLCLAGIRHHEERPTPTPRARGRMRREITEGLKVIAADRWLRSGSLFGALVNFALTGCNTIDVVFLVRAAHLRAGTVGVLFTVGSTGAVFGAIVARRVAARIGTARATVLFYGGFSALALLEPLATHGPGMAFFAIGAFFVDLGVCAGNVLWMTFRQDYAPPELQGRMAACGLFFAYALMPLGSLFAGALGSAFGLRPAMWITTACVPLGALTLLISPIARSRDLPEGPLPLHPSTAQVPAMP
jgi:MFS family permease